MLVLLLLCVVVSAFLVPLEADKVDEVYAQCARDAETNDDKCTRIDYTESGCTYALDVVCMIELRCARMVGEIEGGCVVFQGLDEKTGGCRYVRDAQCMRAALDAQKPLPSWFGRAKDWISNKKFF